MAPERRDEGRPSADDSRRERLVVRLVKVLPFGRLPRGARFDVRIAPDCPQERAQRAAFAALKRTHPDENVMNWEVDRGV